MTHEEQNEHRVRAFYKATVPGHREPLRGLQAPQVVYDLQEGMPIGGGHFAAGEHVVAIGRIEGKTRKAAVPVNVPFVHVWTVREGYLQRLRGFTDTALLAQALAKVE